MVDQQDAVARPRVCTLTVSANDDLRMTRRHPDLDRQPHTFRATGITAYLKNSGRTAQHIANHESASERLSMQKRESRAPGRKRSSKFNRVSHPQGRESYSEGSIKRVSDLAWATPATTF